MSEFTIGRRQLYILPTRVGWYFTLILIALFAVAVKFDNQAAFMMLFILAAIGVITMHATHNNVIGLELNAQPAKAVFVGETAIFPVTVVNTSNKYRRAVWLVCDDFHCLLQIPANQQRRVDIKLPTLQRGYLQCSAVMLSSQFPVGIFFCWTKRFIPSQPCLVYPRPVDIMPLPDSSASGACPQAPARIRIGADDYSGMKAYQEGDRLRDIHWPSLAKTNKLVSIQHEDMSGNSMNLSWFTMPPGMNTEDRLSQLCQWIISAERDGLLYQLEMPSITIGFSQGSAHYHECLSVLALWDAR